jgi:hypothetical protein
VVKQLLVEGESSGSAPAIVVVGDEMFVAFGSNDGNNVILVCSSGDGINWQRENGAGWIWLQQVTGT